MTQPAFAKFPRTPHLFPAPNLEVGGDRVVSLEEQLSILGHDVIVEEKIDGSNVGFSFDENGMVYVQARTRYLGGPTHRPGEPQRSAHPQHHLLFNWAWDRWGDLWELLGTERVLYGEWMYAKHTLKYTSLPDWFIAFDILERDDEDPTTGKFWSTDRRNEALGAIGVHVVPQFCVDSFRCKGDFEDLLASESPLGCDEIEGVYVRAQNDEHLTTRAKVVRPEFKRAHTEGAHDWSKTWVREMNELRGDEDGQ